MAGNPRGKDEEPLARPQLCCCHGASAQGQSGFPPCGQFALLPSTKRVLSLNPAAFPWLFPLLVYSLVSQCPHFCRCSTVTLGLPLVPSCFYILDTNELAGWESPSRGMIRDRRSDGDWRFPIP